MKPITLSLIAASATSCLLASSATAAIHTVSTPVTSKRVILDLTNHTLFDGQGVNPATYPTDFILIYHDGDIGQFDVGGAYGSSSGESWSKTTPAETGAVVNFALGSTVDGTLNYPEAHLHVNFSSPEIALEQFTIGTIGYAAFVVNDGSPNERYGYAEFALTSNQITVFGYRYSDTPFESLNIEAISHLPEPAETVASVAAIAAGLVFYRRRKAKS